LANSKLHKEAWKVSPIKDWLAGKRKNQTTNNNPKDCTCPCTDDVSKITKGQGF
jgi:hypothetical protein